MCVVAYNDELEGGAVQIQNSWGSWFAEEGFFWMRYADFNRWCREAYGLYPRLPSEACYLQATIGLRSTRGGHFALQAQSSPLPSFITASPIPRGEKFKLEFSNDLPCYLYAYGLLPNGQFEQLFPPDTNHSAYVGVVGTRLLPTDRSFVLDDVRQPDQMLILLGYQPFSSDTLLQQLNTNNWLPPRLRVQRWLQNQAPSPNSLEVTEGEVGAVGFAFTDSTLCPIWLTLKK
jgi:hypothetical protein